MTNAVLFSKCERCGSIRHTTELSDDDEGRLRCQDTVRCRREKSRSATSEAPGAGASTDQATKDEGSS